jgi:hypothetical protein
MQIHEISLPMPSAVGTVKKYAKAAMDPAAWGNKGGLQANLSAQETSQQTTDYINKLANEWALVAQSVLKPEVDTQPGVKPVTRPGVSAQPTTPLTKSKYGTVAPISAPKAGTPTAAEYEKLQQRIQAATSKPTVQEAFSDLPGNRPQVGAPVDPRITAKPKSAIQNTNIRQSNQANRFMSWVATKLKSTIPGTSIQIGLDTLMKDPATKQSLDKFLIDVIKTANDPVKNDQAVKQYLTAAVTGLQKASAAIRASTPANQKRSTIGNIDQKTLYQLGKDIITRGEQVTVPTTGSPTIDKMLQQAGLLK